MGTASGGASADIADNYVAWPSAAEYGLDAASG